MSKESDPRQMHILDLDINDHALGGIEEPWSPPSFFPDLKKADRISIELET